MKNLTEIIAAELDQVVSYFNNLGWKIIRFSDRPQNKKDFILALSISGLPFDPPIIGGTSWDSLEDSLSAGLQLSKESGFIFIWECPMSLFENESESYFVACSILNDVGNDTHKLKSFLIVKSS